jgi:hypothetical protein
VELLGMAHRDIPLLNQVVQCPGFRGCPEFFQFREIIRTLPEKDGGLRGTAWHKMPVITGFFGSGVLTALSEHEAAFFRYFKK